MDHLRQRHPQQRQLEDVLQDPEANWSEIREAMRASRGCTNAAIMGAIASGRGVAVVPCMGMDAKNSISSKSGTVVDTSANNDALNAHMQNEPSGGQEIKTMLAPLNDSAAPAPGAESPEDLTNSQNRRPSRRRRTRGACRRGLKSSMRRSQQRRGSVSDSEHECSMNASINMMDFGVSVNVNRVGFSPDIDLCDIHSSFESSGVMSSYSDLVDSSGFLDWDRKRKNNGLSLSNASSSARSDYGDLVDSSGFLDWDRKAPSLADQKEQEKKETILDSFSPTRVYKGMNGNSCEREREDSSQNNSSIKSSAGRKKDWNIEDYEDPLDNEADTRPFRGRVFADRLKRYIPHQKSSKRNQLMRRKTEPAITQKAVDMESIREALKKVSIGADEVGGSAPSSRPSSAVKEDAFEGKSKASKPTVVKLPTFLGGGGAHFRGGLGDSHDGHAALHDAGSFDGSDSKIPDRRIGSFLWKEGWKSSSHEQHGDLREAIWINRKDGNVDIEKERRKLYTNEQIDDENDQKRRRSRATIMGLEMGLERPKLPSKGTYSSNDNAGNP